MPSSGAVFVLSTVFPLHAYTARDYVDLLPAPGYVALSIRNDYALVAVPCPSLVLRLVLPSPALACHPPPPPGVLFYVRGPTLRPRSALQVQLGVLDLEARRCIQSENVYGAVVCPEGFFKVTEDAFDSTCMNLGSEYDFVVDDYIRSFSPPREALLPSDHSHFADSPVHGKSGSVLLFLRNSAQLITSMHLELSIGK